MTNSLSKFSDDDILHEAQRRTTHAKKIANDALLTAQQAAQREQNALQREQAALTARTQAQNDLQVTQQREQAALASASTLQTTVSELRLDVALTSPILDYTALKAGDAVTLASTIFYAIPNNINTPHLRKLQAIGDKLYTFRNKLRPNRMGNFHFRDEKTKAFDTLCKTVFSQLKANYSFSLTPAEQSRLLQEDPTLLSPIIRRRKAARDAKRRSRVHILSQGGPYR
jgi:multidrug efflux pump subunit AcrA (membrane-fusion protein)